MYKSLLSIVLASALIGCGDVDKTETNTEAKAVQVNGETVATVNGSPIGSEDFAMLAARKNPGKGSELSLEERKEVLDDLVTEELLYQKALAEGYDKDPKVKKVMVNALIRKEIYDSIKTQISLMKSCRHTTTRTLKSSQFLQKCRYTLFW